MAGEGNGEEATGNMAAGRLLVLSAAILWSAGGVVTKSIDMPPTSIAFYRSFFAGLSLLPFVRPSRWVFRPVMLPIAAVFGAMVGLYIASIKATTAANAIFLQCSATFWIVPLSLLFLRERPDRRSLVGIALAVPGIVAIILWGHGGTPREWQGVAMGLGSGVFYACVILGMRGLRGLSPIWLSIVNNLGGALALGAGVLLFVGAIQVPTATEALVLIAFGVFQMAIPYVLFARGLRTVSAAEAGLLSLAEPLLSPVWVLLARGEVPARATIVGGLFLLVGVACRYAPWPRRRPEPVSAAAPIIPPG